MATHSFFCLTHTVPLSALLGYMTNIILKNASGTSCNSFYLYLQSVIYAASTEEHNESAQR